MMISLLFSSYSFGIGPDGLLNIGIGSDGKPYEIQRPGRPVKPPPPKYNTGHSYTGNECVVLKGQYDNIRDEMAKIKANTNKRLQSLKGKRKSKRAYMAWCKKKGMTAHQAKKRGYTGKWWTQAIDKQGNKVRSNARNKMSEYQAEKKQVVARYNRLCKKK